MRVERVYDDLLVVIECYERYIDNQLNKSIPNSFPHSSYDEKVAKDFNFERIMFFHKMFKNPAIPSSAIYTVNFFYARFDPKKQKKINIRLELLRENENYQFLENLLESGYVTMRM